MRSSSVLQFVQDGDQPLVLCRCIILRGLGGMAAASFQKLNLKKWAQPLGDLNFQRAC